MPQTGEVVVPLCLIILCQEHLKDRREVKKGGTLFLLYEPQRKLRVKSFNNDIFPPGVHNGHGP